MKNESWNYYKYLLTSWQWRKVRRKKLNLNVFCERCVRDGKRVPNLATDVHHITPVMRAAPDRERMKQLFFDPHNLMALCPECHRKMHQELTMHVSKDKRKTIRHEQLKNFKAKFFTNLKL